jgi:hypothetical protein
MSETFGRIASIDLAAWLPSLPVWTAGAVAALLVVACFFSFSRAGRAGPVGVSARVALVLTGAGAAFIALEAWSRLDLADERRALEVRAQELLMRSAMPGSAFACLGAVAGDVVESSCEKAVFQTPEATAAALSYVAAQLALLADFTAHARRSGADFPAALADLRRSIESDRFGLVARVLAVRDGCTPAACQTFTLLADSGRIAINLSDRSYDLYVARHAPAWPAGAKPPVAVATAGGEGEAPPPAAAAGRGGLFFPSAASIPPVTIMNAEPTLPPETTGSTPPSAPAPKQAPSPQRRPAAAASGGSTQRPPIDLNATSRTGPPASAPQ